MGQQFQGERGDIPDADARRATSTDPRRPLTSRNVHVTWFHRAGYCVLDVPEGIRNANKQSMLLYTVHHTRYLPLSRKVIYQSRLPVYTLL